MNRLSKKISFFIFCLALGYTGVFLAMLSQGVKDLLILNLGGLEAGLFCFWLNEVWETEEYRSVRVPGVDK